MQNKFKQLYISNSNLDNTIPKDDKMSDIRETSSINCKMWILLGCIFIFWFALFLFANPPTADDETFLSTLEEKGFLGLWLNQEKTWSSRFIIEFVQFSVYCLPHYVWFFRLINSICFTLISYCLLRFTNTNSINLKSITIACIPFMFPIGTLLTAGWIATSANYLWTAALLMYAFLPIQQLLQHKRLHRHYYVTATLSTLYAANGELFATLEIGLLISFLIYTAIKQHKFLVYPFLLTLISFALLLHAMLWPPSVENRNAIEIASKYPSFPMEGIADKLTNGYLLTMMFLLFPSNLFMSLFCILLGSAVQIHHSEKAVRVFGWLPSVFFITFGPLQNLICTIFPNFELFYFLSFDQLSLFNPEDWISFIIQILLCTIILFDCLIAWNTIDKGLLAALLWSGGILSRTIMGFSPTLYASNTRTAIPLILCIFLIISLLLKEKHDNYQVKYIFAKQSGLLILIGFSYVYLFFSI